MCGLFGFVTKNDRGPDLRRLERIAVATESRGRHAFGFAWIDDKGRLKMFKQTGKISDHLAILRLAENARMLIGHCRYATHGDPRFNINNHPHPADGGWFVHNGVIGNAQRLIEQYELARVSACDSEVIGLLIESLEGDMLDRVIESCHTATTDNNLAVLGLWKNPNRLIALRAGNSLHLGETTKGYYFASLADHLPDPFLVRDNTALEFRADKVDDQGNVALVAYDTLTTVF